MSRLKRIRDTFYMNMWEDYQLEKTEIINILKKYNIDISSFKPSMLDQYENTIKEYMRSGKFREAMTKKPPRCPVPECEGEKVGPVRVFGENRWFCTKMKDEGRKWHHYWVYESARLRIVTEKKEYSQELHEQYMGVLEDASQDNGEPSRDRQDSGSRARSNVRGKRPERNREGNPKPA